MSNGCSCVRPGWYTNWTGAGWNAVNVPVDVGYTHVFNQKVQAILGFSWNPWRKMRFLGGGGVRWQINNRWKLKLFPPTPDIEYQIRPNLNVTPRADIRGDSFRMGPHYGDNKGNSQLNNALVDCQEVRVGSGISWNIQPLIELNMMTGYMVGRQFDFHNNNVKLNGSAAPFIMLQLHWLFKFPGEPLRIPARQRISIRDLLNYF